MLNATLVLGFKSPQLTAKFSIAAKFEKNLYRYSIPINIRIVICSNFMLYGCYNFGGIGGNSIFLIKNRTQKKLTKTAATEPKKKQNLVKTKMCGMLGLDLCAHICA